MADSADRNHSHSSNPSKGHHQPDEENTFIALRRYADEHFSALLQSLIGLPSAFSPPSPRDWMYIQGGDPAVRFHHHRLRATETGAGTQDSQSSGSRHSSEKCTCGRDGGTTTYTDGNDPSDVPWLESRRHFEHQFPSSIFDSPLENLWPLDPLHFFSILPRSSFPFSFDFLSSSTFQGWPISYLLFSPYSPLHLERQKNMRHKPYEKPLSSLFSALIPSHEAHESDTPRWREAFEDLLRIENGKDMLNSDLGAVVRKEKPKDWISGMIGRGSLGPHWTHVQKGPNDYFNYRYSQPTDGAGKGKMSRPGSSHEYDDREHSMQGDKWLTELDLYEKFLDRVNEPSDEEDIPLVSPLMGMIIEDRLRRRERLLEGQRRWQHTVENKDFDFQRDGSDVNSNDTASIQASQPSPPSPYITSTITTTERRTLPDGSVQTTITRKKRFSDGKEESNETVQVENANHPPSGSETSQAQLQSAEQTNDRGSQRKGGWFWKD
ncbi:uncharacterized protein BDCG_04426 [Blastomyces dermatitidis ER-3]|uniref:Uncharacterized protein n=2 Tax=Blastomyces TaxID=229219 RepID=A0A179UA91_BLAGS|nr:uncharacterized protein BDBG_01405 [Blastomyces gilchristii SLH14081]XP_045276261.1 uncharacterized protein BDCG_04426 [Blastomyces dermatitidis ER-3]EEQ89306.1 hypothetical protein BDCG_04426 [Blastomyces dermatitidis ER-3]EQL33462.1 hypothetical protein BDFG_04605 [Blastomyces dermatitidis ATCC 26199]OAT04926.1 hypothetical protein BDBG_01405 [Blastomyces gilchristii SLH14081]